MCWAGLLFLGNVLLTWWNQSKLWGESEDQSHLIFMEAEMESLYKAHRGLVTAQRQLCLSYYTAKTLNPQSTDSLWIISASSASPSIHSFLIFLPCEHQSSGTNEWWSGSPELRLSAPQSCTPERRKSRTSYHMLHFLFLLYHQRNMQKSLPLLYS